MRIISGNFKGKKIFFPKNKKTRPLRDLVKESIFNLIENSNKFNILIKNSDVLDLFSGSGSFGLECISRGAKKVTFVENDLDALNILKKNINSTNSLFKCNIIKTDCFKFINSVTPYNSKLDLIFLDPPYKEEKINKLISEIISLKLLKENGIVIIHRHKKDNLEITNNSKLLSRGYGISK